MCRIHYTAVVLNLWGPWPRNVGKNFPWTSWAVHMHFRLVQSKLLMCRPVAGVCVPSTLREQGEQGMGMPVPMGMCAQFALGLGTVANPTDWGLKSPAIEEIIQRQFANWSSFLQSEGHESSRVAIFTSSRMSVRTCTIAVKWPLAETLLCSDASIWLCLAEMQLYQRQVTISFVWLFKILLR